MSCLSAGIYVIMLWDSLLPTGGPTSHAVSSEGPTKGLCAGWVVVNAGSQVYCLLWPLLMRCVMLAQGQAGLVRATQAGAASLSLNLTLPPDGGTQALAPAGSPARAGPIPGSGGSSLAIGSSLSPQTRIYRQSCLLNLHKPQAVGSPGHCSRNAITPCCACVMCRR